MVRSIDLNADVGEECGDDASLLEIVTSANVATGAHAGGGDVLDETVRLAVAAGCAVGAHPSYQDRAGFGRVSMADRVDLAGLAADLVDQIMHVGDACRRHGSALQHVKAHGALYNDAARDEILANVLIDAMQRAEHRLGLSGLAVVGPPESALATVAAHRGVVLVREAFADRAYAGDGSLVPRTQSGAVLTDSAVIAERASALALRQAIVAVDGSSVLIEADSLCLHGDTPDAVSHARAVRRALEDLGIVISSVAPR